jgi:hypothetical protein
MKKNDLLDAELSETPRVPLRGVSSPVVPLIAAALVTVSGCGVEVIGRTVSDAGSYPADARDTDDDVGVIGVQDAGVYDAGTVAPDAGDDEGP